jgi:hypothetical protein
MKRNDTRMANEVPPSQFTVMPDKTKEPSQDDFRSGYKRELFERSLDISRSKMDGMKETEQSRSQWGRRQEAVYQEASPSSNEISSSQCLAQIVTILPSCMILVDATTRIQTYSYFGLNCF